MVFLQERNYAIASPQRVFLFYGNFTVTNRRFFEVGKYLGFWTPPRDFPFGKAAHIDWAFFYFFLDLSGSEALV
jgi:hypothetical protein